MGDRDFHAMKQPPSLRVAPVSIDLMATFAAEIRGFDGALAGARKGHRVIRPEGGNRTFETLNDEGSPSSTRHSWRPRRTRGSNPYSESGGSGVSLSMTSLFCIQRHTRWVSRSSRSWATFVPRRFAVSSFAF